MRNYILITMLALLSFGCSSDDDAITLSISADELTFTVEGGESTVSVTTNGTWNCSYTADWLLVRQQQYSMKIIVDANETAELRSDCIEVTGDGQILAQIMVSQEARTLTVPTDMFETDNMPCEFLVDVECNTNWSFSIDSEWMVASKSGESLYLSVERNYAMEGRTDTITVSSGDMSQEIIISQQASPWYESLEMVDVEGGTFYMGAQSSSVDGQNYDTSAETIESPVHEVSVSSFLMGKYEVTQAQWIAATGSNPSTMEGNNLPVETVTWGEVQEFISLLNEYSGQTYRLPTEAEWEFAARGGNLSEGNLYSGSDAIGICAWYYSNSDATTHEVGSKYVNELGIYDMSGNVREWCNDWYETYTSSPVSDPQGASSGSFKMSRGGGWTTPAAGCRNSYRHADYPEEPSKDLGFRLVLSVE